MTRASRWKPQVWIDVHTHTDLTYMVFCIYTSIQVQENVSVNIFWWWGGAF